jgi:glucosamine-6-phosphate deaminase
MQVIICDSYEEVAIKAASMLNRLITVNPAAVLGLATGTTPLALYQQLLNRYRAGRIGFKNITTFNLDEYLGLSPEHPMNYRHYMNENLFNHIDIDHASTHFPDSTRKDPRQAGSDYEKKISLAGGIELPVLGIGSNGHIGFNEPTSSLTSRTRVKTLAQQTIRDNSQWFKQGEFQPHLALTMGIATIMEATKIVLMASGESKAQAVKEAVEGPMSAMCPASVLQLHANVTLLLDKEAASLLKLTDYYCWVQRETELLDREYGNGCI